MGGQCYLSSIMCMTPHRWRHVPMRGKLRHSASRTGCGGKHGDKFRRPPRGNKSVASGEDADYDRHSREACTARRGKKAIHSSRRIRIGEEKIATPSALAALTSFHRYVHARHIRLYADFARLKQAFQLPALLKGSRIAFLHHL